MGPLPGQGGDQKKHQLLFYKVSTSQCPQPLPLLYWERGWPWPCRTEGSSGSHAPAPPEAQEATLSPHPSWVSKANSLGGGRREADPGGVPCRCACFLRCGGHRSGAGAAWHRPLPAAAPSCHAAVDSLTFLFSRCTFSACRSPHCPPPHALWVLQSAFHSAAGASS